MIKFTNLQSMPVDLILLDEAEQKQILQASTNIKYVKKCVYKLLEE